MPWDGDQGCQWTSVYELDRRGQLYRGTVTRAVSGHACMNWTDVDNYTISASLNVDDISEVENYCRRVPFTEWNGPSCVTVDDIGMVRLERCDVPYCGNTFLPVTHIQWILWGGGAKPFLVLYLFCISPFFVFPFPFSPQLLCSSLSKSR